MFERWIYAYDVVVGPPPQIERRLLERAREFLAQAVGAPLGEPAGDGSFVLPITSRVAGLDLAKHIRIRIGVASHAGHRVVLPLTWHAEPARFVFPSFDGTLELEPLDSRTSQLTLTGRYRPPMGPAGKLVDIVVLGPVAQQTGEQLLRGVAAALGAPTGQEEEQPPPIATRMGEALRVADVMTSEPLVLDEDVPLRTAALLLFHANISGAPVMSRSGALLGVLSERDLLAKEATYRTGFGRAGRDEDRRREARTVGVACSRPARTTSSDTRLAEAARLMLDADVSRLVVVDRGRVEGIVSRHDVLAALVRDDTQIELAVRHLLERSREEDVRAAVEWGEVRLSGVTRTLSALSRLVEDVEAIDGIMRVDTSGLSYAEDDLAPMIPLM